MKINCYKSYQDLFLITWINHEMDFSKSLCSLIILSTNKNAYSYRPQIYPFGRNVAMGIVRNGQQRVTLLDHPDLAIIVHS